MLPTVFEFKWDAGHMIFFGAFYAVVTVVLISLLHVVIKSLIDVYKDTSARRDEISESETLGRSESHGETDEPAQEVAAET